MVRQRTENIPREEWKFLPLAEQQVIASDEGFYWGRVRWYNRWQTDLILFWANNHPLLSVLTANRHNLFRRWERFIVLLLHLGFCYFATVFTRENFHPYDNEHFYNKDFYMHPVVPIVSVCTIVYTELVKSFMMVQCLRPGHSCAGVGHRIKCCFTEIAHMQAVVSIIVTIGLVVWAAFRDHENTAIMWTITTVIGWILYFITDTFKFIIHYRYQNSHKLSKAFPIQGLPTHRFITEGEPCCYFCCFAYCVRGGTFPPDEEAPLLVTEQPTNAEKRDKGKATVENKAWPEGPAPDSVA